MLNAKQIIKYVNELAKVNKQPLALTYGESEVETNDNVLIACSLTVPSSCTVRREMQLTGHVSIATKRAVKMRLAGEVVAELLYKLLNT